MIIIILIILLSIFLFLSILLSIYLHSKYNPHLVNKKLLENKNHIIEYVDDKNNRPYLVKKNLDGSLSNDDFRVVSCADLHLSTEECVFGLTVLERLIDKTNPDLLILLGDNACGRSDTFIEEKLIKLFNKKKLHYAFVLGNHDSEYLINKELKNKESIDKDLYLSIRKKNRLFKFEALMKSKYCVAKLDNLDLSGVGNYSIDLKNANGIIQTLYFFDSGDYAFGVKRKAIGSEKRSYDNIQNDQLEWYCKDVKNNIAPSIAFFHIPLKEYYYAYKLSLNPFFANKKIMGNNYELPCFGDCKDNTFKCFKENKNTKIVVVGHDHKNDSCIEYKGIKLMYSLGLQYDGAYNRRKKNPKLFKKLYELGYKCYVEGVSVFDINTNKVDITPVYAEKENVFYGLEKYYKRAWLEGTYKK